MPNISFPSDEEVKHEEFLPEGVYGQTMLAFLRYHLADLEQELKSALNNDALALKLDVLAPDENINDCYAESGKLWQKFHGIMWGPFES